VARARGEPGQGGAGRERPPRVEREFNEYAAIPNPLMQTFDKRAIREARAPRREISEDGPIPNPLEQTYDKRGVQGARGFGGGMGGGGRKGGGGGGGNGGQPDPLKTAVGYIGADAFVRKFQGNGGGGHGGGGGGQRNGGNGGGGGGGNGGRRRGGR
jgi:23S rRNA pseudouridine2605 synthase